MWNKFRSITSRKYLCHRWRFSVFGIFYRIGNVHYERFEWIRAKRVYAIRSRIQVKVETTKKYSLFFECRHQEWPHIFQIIIFSRSIAIGDLFVCSAISHKKLKSIYASHIPPKISWIRKSMANKKQTTCCSVYIRFSWTIRKGKYLKI